MVNSEAILGSLYLEVTDPSLCPSIFSLPISPLSLGATQENLEGTRYWFPQYPFQPLSSFFYLNCRECKNQNDISQDPCSEGFIRILCSS